MHETLDAEPRVPSKGRQHPASRFTNAKYMTTIESSYLPHKSYVSVSLYLCTTLCFYCVLRIVRASEAVRKVKMMAFHFAHTNPQRKKADLSKIFAPTN